MVARFEMIGIVFILYLSQHVFQVSEWIRKLEKFIAWEYSI